MRHLLTALLLSLLPGPPAAAQDSAGDGAPPLIDETFLTGRSFVSLAPPPEPASVWVCVGADSGGGTRLVRPEADTLAASLTQTWIATARCDAGVSQVRITGPAGVRRQTFPIGRRYVDGTAEIQGHDPQAVVAHCRRWYQSLRAACDGDLDAPGCAAEQERRFSFGPGAPLPESPAITIAASCVNGELGQRALEPRLELRCLREESCLSAF
ncbi:hypothetical protein [Salipiger mangrovisoli]|uniref:Secreted protein n=1 Tax=Salipiger mangrovisoli TaxID=2865933 RepID=A0ABR9X3I7_9RHOB|nr:hypothetical protein [Salipiger mangrovisoli]MBE9638071.1 hypothetical protein [Salipiger mangrovisoli]